MGEEAVISLAGHHEGCLLRSLSDACGRSGSCDGISSACALRTKALDIECDADVARMFERERHRHAFALPQWGIQIHEHQMRAAGRETDGLAGFDQEAAVDR